MKKRTECYIMKPQAYEIACDICGGKVEWSEYEKHVWCPKCLLDTKGTGGIFDGPIPIEVCTGIFGLSFDKVDLNTKERLYMKVIDKKVIWVKK